MDLRSDMTVDLVRYMGDDAGIVQAMVVSTQGAEAREADASYGRINFLMANRHGTPFEHGAITFYIEAPIFVFREFHRHRVGWSYNEVSGRYRELPATFYTPGPERPLVQVGKPGHYTFEPGNTEQYSSMVNAMAYAYDESYKTYQYLLSLEVAKEVARAVLPVATYTAMFATCNPRSLMHFLSLRTKHEASKFPSYPQAEIQMVADKMEAIFRELFPLTYEAWHNNGRVAP